MCDGAEYVVEREGVANADDESKWRRAVAFAVNGQPQGVAFEDIAGGESSLLR